MKEPWYILIGAQLFVDGMNEQMDECCVLPSFSENKSYTERFQ